MNFLSTIATFYKDGGIFMHAVLAISVLVVAIVVERMIVIGKATALNSKKLTDDLVRCVSRGDLGGARTLCSRSSTPIARVALEMLQAAPADEETLQAVADDAVTLTLPALAKRLSHMAVLANSATLIGLLGTITGLITAISGIGVADAAQRSAYLASGISEALHTTAFGLLIAIPTLMIQGWLSGRVEGVAQDIDELTIRLGRALGHATAPRVAHAPPTPISKVQAVPQTPRTGTLGGGR